MSGDAAPFVQQLIGARIVDPGGFKPRPERQGSDVVVAA
jgi:hypothetical protein